MLSLAEQIFLLSLDDNTGHSFPLPEKALELALAAALLMGLADAKRIDPSVSPLRILNSELTGDALLDDVLLDLQKRPGSTLGDSIRRIAGHSHVIKEVVARRLVEKGILRKEKETFLWVLADERFPIIDHQEERAVRQRIRQVVLEERTPEPKDIAIIALVEACDLMYTILTPVEYKKARNYLDALDQLDPVGSTIIGAIAREDHVLQDTSHALM